MIRFAAVSMVLTAFFILPAMGIGYGNGSDAETRRLAKILLEAHRGGRAIPVLSIQSPLLDVPSAYRVQILYVHLRAASDPVAGFKAGLTSTASMKRFGMQNPVAGVLLTSGKTVSHLPVQRDSPGISVMMIETEIGFLVGKPIRHRVQSIAALKNYIRHVAPVIELPDLGFTDITKIKGPDIIAANVGAAKFMVGTPQDTHGLNLDTIEITLRHNGKIVNRGKGGGTLNGQWNAALWLVNTMVDHGWRIEPGHLLITGALGKMIPAKPGKYSADYASFGSIDFEIKEE
ncbi:MAG: 4-oxalocrotonate decarboxylase [bacterium]|nr:4-oxalocrotonate decarboxylase [bacterium]